MTDRKEAMNQLIADSADLIDPVQDRLVLAVRDMLTDDSQAEAIKFADALREALAWHGLILVESGYGA